jgi:uncharacterized membrane protein HdeD (DUF308 family)
MAISTMMGRGDFEDARSHWGWLLVLGIVMVVLGTLAAGMAVVTSVVTMVFLGVVLLAAGAVQIYSAIREHANAGFWLHLLAGVLDVVLGGMLVSRPLAGAAVLTLVLAAFLFVGGIYRCVGAVSLRYPSWGWALVSGIVEVILAILLLVGWPVSALWFIGFCVGVDLIFRGWAWVMFATVVRKVLPAAA